MRTTTIRPQYHPWHPVLLVPLVAVLAVLFTLPRAVTAQQAPAYDPIPFGDDDDGDTVIHRHNMCERHRQVYLDQVQLPDAVRGLNLSVALLNYEDPDDQRFFALNANGVIEDTRGNIPLFALILDELARRAGFSWRESFAAIAPLSSDSNRSYSELLQWQVETFDIAMGKWDRTSGRIANAISFPARWLDASVIMIQRQEAEDPSGRNIWSFLRPFQPTVWLLIVGAAIGSGLLYYVLERMDAAADERELESQPGGAIYYSFINFTGHNEFRPQTNAARLLTFSMTLWALTTGAAYTANLASFLVVRRQPDATIQSVQDAIALRAPICLQRGVALDEYITDKYPGAILVRKRLEREVVQGLYTGECVAALVPQYAYEMYVRNTNINTDCTLEWKGRVERYVPSGLATIVDAGTLCTSLISHVLDYHLLEMQADGFLEQAWQGYLQKVGDPSCLRESSGTLADSSSDVEETYSLSVQEMSGIFIVHGILCSIALVTAAVQCYIKRQQLKHTSNEEASTEDDADDSALANLESDPLPLTVWDRSYST